MAKYPSWESEARTAANKNWYESNKSKVLQPLWRIENRKKAAKYDA
jgi:hypothetical protein